MRRPSRLVLGVLLLALLAGGCAWMQSDGTGMRRGKLPTFCPWHLSARPTTVRPGQSIQVFSTGEFAGHVPAGTTLVDLAGGYQVRFTAYARHGIGSTSVIHVELRSDGAFSTTFRIPRSARPGGATVSISNDTPPGMQPGEVIRLCYGPAGLSCELPTVELRIIK